METNQLLNQVKKTAREFQMLLTEAKNKGLKVELKDTISHVSGEHHFELNIYKEKKMLSLGEYDTEARANKVEEAFGKFRNEKAIEKGWIPRPKAWQCSEEEQNTKSVFLNMLLKAANDVNVSDEEMIPIPKTELSNDVTCEVGKIVKFLKEFALADLNEDKMPNGFDERITGEMIDRINHLYTLVYRNR